MLRKWEYTAKVLENLKAPKKVIDAAQEIDNILVGLGLDHNTSQWIDYVSHNEYQDEDWYSLSDIVGEAVFCSACFDADDNDINCRCCKLSKGRVFSCTPRSVYPIDYCRVVTHYVSDRY